MAGIEWILDTGASHHITGTLSVLANVHSIAACPVGLPNGCSASATMEGDVYLTDTLILHNVLFVLGFQCHLISVSHLLADNDCTLQFTSSLCAIQDRSSGTLIGAGERRGGLYYFRTVPKIHAAAVADLPTFDLWHQRLGHPSERVVKLLLAIRSSSSKKKLHHVCDVCPMAKQTRDCFPSSTNKASRLFELVHCDLWGPYSVPSSCGATYFLTLVDDYSRAVWVYLLHNKTEVHKSFLSFFAMIERQFDTSVKIVRSDNGTEFQCMLPFFDQSGILFQTSCTGTPQQNGRVERKHQHILNVSRALMFQANLPVDYWGECVLTAVHLINRTPSGVLGNKTPYEMIFGHEPDFEALRVFGCLCFAHNQKSKGNKFAPRSRKCVFLGYATGKKGWKLKDLATGVIFVSRDVIFFESSFPFSSASSPADSTATLESCDTQPSPLTDFSSPADFGPSPPHSSNPAIPSLSGPLTESSLSTNLPTNISTSTNIPPSTNTQPSPSTASPASSYDPQPTHIPASINSPPTFSVASTSDQPSPSTAPTSAQLSSEPTDPPSPPLGRGHRAKQPNCMLRDYFVHSVQLGSPSPGSTHASHSPGTPYPLANFVSCDNFSMRHRVFLAAVDEGVEPKSFKEAMNSSGWREAMQKEISALEDNRTWVMTDLPPGKKALGCKWVYRIKYNSDGSVERLKARLVILGNHQVEGIDYHETFAPVAKMVTVRTFLAVAAARNWEVHQMDVHNAFLHGDLDEEVYMKLPPGFNPTSPGKVCRLQKSLYGLKQAPRCWFAKLATSLRQYGFSRSYSDYSLFTYCRGNVRLHVLVYVDDLIISGNDSAALSSFKSYLGDCFRMKDLGPLKYFLGIEVARSADGFFLSQRKYTLDIISETGLSGAKPSDTPLEQNHQLALADGPLHPDPAQYRRLVGRLIYLAFTRPDLAYVVHVLAQFMHQPRHQHWEAALRVVRYLKGSPGQGIILSSLCDLHLTAWCDSDWASCPLTRRSVSGWLIFLGSSPISWKTRK